MGSEMMDIDQLAIYLQRDLREVTKMASRGHIPGHKVSGQWRFARAEINHWIETQLHTYTEQELETLESHGGEAEIEPLLTSLLSEACIAVPLPAGTRASVLKELVVLAEQSWQVYDPEAILDAIRAREEVASTALADGVAIPHPHRPLPGALGESIVAFGRTSKGIPFGAPDRGLTDLFFLVCCQNDRTHLRVLARLSRLIRRPGFLDALRSAETPGDARNVITDAETSLIAEV